jgi:hypothetical protein
VSPVLRRCNDLIRGVVTDEVDVVIQPEPRLKLAQLKVDMATAAMSADALELARKYIAPTEEDKREQTIKEAMKGRDGWDEPLSVNRAGIAWREAEWLALKGSFEEGLKLDDLCRVHGRTSGAILAALVKAKLLVQTRSGHTLPDGSEWGR